MARRALRRTPLHAGVLVTSVLLLHLIPVPGRAQAIDREYTAKIHRNTVATAKRIAKKYRGI